MAFPADPFEASADTLKLGYRPPKDAVGLTRAIGDALALPRARAMAGNSDVFRLETGEVQIPSDNGRYGKLTGREQMADRLHLSLSKEVLREARQGLAFLQRQVPYAALSEAQRNALEAILYVTGRPSLRLKDGVPAEWPPPNWTMIGDHHPEFARVSASVGRIDVANASADYVGTCFVIGERLLLTNRHVAATFCSDPAQAEEAWSIAPGKLPRVAFGYEDPHEPGPSVSIARIVLVARPPVDLAILATDAALPVPLEIERCESGYEDPVYSIGYPGRDPGGDREIMRRLFGTAFGIKRLAPGRLRDPAEFAVAFEPSDVLHDCTTLPGASGSCVMSFRTHKLVALHASGAHHFVNTAVEGGVVAHHVERARALL